MRDDGAPQATRRQTAPPRSRPPSSRIWRPPSATRCSGSAQRPARRTSSCKPLNGSIYVRYLPNGATIGTKDPYLTVATYPFAGAYAAIQAVSSEKGATPTPIPGNGLAETPDSTATSVHAAFPGVDYQIEVFDPTPGTAAALVKAGGLAAVGKSDTAGAAAVGPRLATAAELATYAASAGHPVYWAGTKSGFAYEVKQTADGQIYIRYLPTGTAAGDSGQHFTVGTYPYPAALDAIKALAKEPNAESFPVPGGGLAVFDSPIRRASTSPIRGRTTRSRSSTPRPRRLATSSPPGGSTASAEPRETVRSCVVSGRRRPHRSVSRSAPLWRLETPAGLVAMFAAGLPDPRRCSRPMRGSTETSGCSRSGRAASADVGTRRFYDRGQFADYPPGYLYVLWLTGKISRDAGLSAAQAARDPRRSRASPGSPERSRRGSRRPRLRERWPVRALVAAAVLFNPAVIALSAVWGQVDSVPAMFVLVVAPPALHRSRSRCGARSPPSSSSPSRSR